MEASSSSDSLFDGMPDHFPDSMPSSDEDFEDERPGALSRLTDACMELVSAVGDLSVAAGRGTLVAIGRVANRNFLAHRHKESQIRRMQVRKQEIARIRSEQMSLKKVDILEQQLAALQAEFSKLNNNNNNSNSQQPAQHAGAPMTPCTPQPPHTGPHSNPVEASPADLGSELDFLASALDMIVSEQDKMELPPPDVHESWNQREDSLYREDSPMQLEEKFDAVILSGKEEQPLFPLPADKLRGQPHMDKCVDKLQSAPDSPLPMLEPCSPLAA